MGIQRHGSKFIANGSLSIANAMSTYQLDFIGGDAVSQLEIDERKAKYVELAGFMNAEPDEIGTSSPASTR
jgi:hypothetical protein